MLFHKLRIDKVFLLYEIVHAVANKIFLQTAYYNNHIYILNFVLVRHSSSTDTVSGDNVLQCIELTKFSS